MGGKTTVRWSGLRRRILDGIAMALVTGLSFLLLLYVGHGEAQRSFERFHLDKLAAQGRMLQGAIESYLRRDLPLPQYVGFRARAERLRASDDQLVALAVLDAERRPLFVHGDRSIGLLPIAPRSGWSAIDGAEVHQDRHYLQLVLPLANRYERVGQLVLTIHRATIDEAVKAQFLPLLWIAAALSLLFAIIVGLARDRLADRRIPLLHLLYGGFFLTMAAVVIAGMVQLYSRGAQLEAKALADSLGQRMTEIMGFHLDLQQLQGVDRAFGEYRRLNPDIAAVALIVDGRIAIHTDPFMVGRPWQTDASTYEYRVDVTPPGSTQRVSIAVTLPEDIVYGRILRNAKNFLALFVASAFLANLFLQLAETLRRTELARSVSGDERALALVKPVFYLAMFVEHLIYPFLPQHVQAELGAQGLSEGLAGLVVTTYYLCFALTLVPAGWLTQRFGSRRPMAFGLALTTAGLLVLLLPGLVPLVIGRALGGIGQGLLLIGVQSYILAVAAPERRTQGAAIIVFGFQGGMIAGMAIGSLLVVNLGSQGVFALAAVAAAATAMYALTMIPAEPISNTSVESGPIGALHRLGSELGRALRSRELLATIGFVGIPAKAVLTGAIVFALPLLMTSQGYRQEDIGQLLMIYAGAVVVASGVVSRLVDRNGATGFVLGIGALLSGLGLALIGLVDAGGLGHGSYAAILQTMLLALGIVIVGGAHGLINAPIVTHVAQLGIARRIGAGSATAAYRFLERIGHVLGPLLVGQLLWLTGALGTAFQTAGIVVCLLGAAFLALQLRHTPEKISGRLSGELLGLYLNPPDLALALAVDGGEVGSSDGRRRSFRSDDAGSEEGAITRQRVDHLRAFLEPTLAALPPGTRLRLVGCGDPTCYRAATGHLPAVEVELAATAELWLARVQQVIELTSRDPAARARNALRGLAAALGAPHQADRGTGRPFVWVRPSRTDARSVAEHASG